MQGSSTAERVAGQARIDLASYELSALGYVAEEWFLGGSAVSYRSKSAQTPDGRWDVRLDCSAPFATRMVVVRPIDEARFSGTVVLEWLNVSYGQDIGAEWLYTHRRIMRWGAVWVGVSAQRAGILGGGLISGLHLVKANRDRYGALRHPGDGYAFDIFSQAAIAIRTPGGPLGSLRVKTVLAAGASQSAIYLVTYINAIDPLAQAIDGYLVHGRGARGAWVEGSLLDPRRSVTDLIRQRGLALPGHRIRQDVRVPVMTVQSETDAVLLASALARQPDTERTRLWEIAGASHFDSYGVRAAFRDNGALSPDALRHALRPVISPRGIRTSAPINGGPQQHYVLQGALDSLRRWVEDGTLPPTADILATRRFQPLRLLRDRDGLVVGGVRTPWISSPVATLSGFGQCTPGIGMLMGSTRAWSQSALAHRYPDGKEQYFEEFAAATRDATRARFLLADDESEILALGRASWPLDCPADTAAIRHDERTPKSAAAKSRP